MSATQNSISMPTRNTTQQGDSHSLRVGLVGDPISHSFSPRMQQAAFDALAIPARYELWPTPADQLVERIRSLCNDHFLGANVTLPHTQTVLPLLDKLDPMAERIGAVNTIVHRDDYLHGYNTAGQALLLALHEHNRGVVRANGRISLHNYTAILLGAGGAARAAAFALADAAIARLVIFNRHLERAQLLASEVQQYYHGPIFSLSDPAFLIPHSSSIIINATSVGLRDDASPLPTDILERFDADTFVYDMIYNPSQTLFLCQARVMGLSTANGLSMLLHQGALAFTLWTGKKAPLYAMRQALATS